MEMIFDARHFGQVVKRHREGSEISQRELARRCKIDSSYLSRIEGGRRTPEVEVLVSITSELGLDATLEILDALVGPAGEPVMCAAAMDVARFMADPEVSDNMKEATSRVIDTILRVR